MIYSVLGLEAFFEPQVKNGKKAHEKIKMQAGFKKVIRTFIRLAPFLSVFLKASKFLK